MFLTDWYRQQEILCNFAIWHGNASCINSSGSLLGSVQRKGRRPEWLYEFLRDADGCWGCWFVVHLSACLPLGWLSSCCLNFSDFYIWPGFSLNNPLHQIVVARYSEQNLTIDFDNFVCCLIRLELLFSEFSLGVARFLSYRHAEIMSSCNFFNFFFYNRHFQKARQWWVRSDWVGFHWGNKHDVTVTPT